MNENLLWRLVVEYKRGVKTQEAWEKFLVMGEKEIDKLDKEIEKLLLKKERMESGEVPSEEEYLKDQDFGKPK